MTVSYVTKYVVEVLCKVCKGVAFISFRLMWMTTGTYREAGQAEFPPLSPPQRWEERKLR